MCNVSGVKNFICELASNTFVNNENFILQFDWFGSAPKAGQFFMVKPLRFSFFLARPISVFEYNENDKTVKFLITKAGKGTEEFSQMQVGEKCELTGPLGNTWEEFLPENGRAALVGGGAGIAPLAALVKQKPGYDFHFFAGFKNGFIDKEEEDIMLGTAKNARKVVVAAEDGRNALSGRIVDYLFEPQDYNVIFSCGPQAMIKALIKKCFSKNALCYVSTESRMACGVGACLGCVINTSEGNKRCCCDGPIFNAGEINFNE